MSEGATLDPVREKSQDKAKREKMGDPARRFDEFTPVHDQTGEDPAIVVTDDLAEPLPAKKSLHLVLKRAALERLEYLKDRVRPGTKTDVIVKSLQLFDFMFREHEKGAVFYVKRPGQKVEELKVFK